MWVLAVVNACWFRLTVTSPWPEPRGVNHAGCIIFFGSYMGASSIMLVKIRSLCPGTAILHTTGIKTFHFTYLCISLMHSHHCKTGGWSRTLGVLKPSINQSQCLVWRMLPPITRIMTAEGLHKFSKFYFCTHSNFLFYRCTPIFTRAHLFFFLHMLTYFYTIAASRLWSTARPCCCCWGPRGLRGRGLNRWSVPPWLLEPLTCPHPPGVCSP